MTSFQEEGASDNDVQPDLNTSKFRRKNLSLLEQIDKRYEGKKVSRKEIFHADSSSEGSDGDNDSDENVEQNAEEESDNDSGEQADEAESELSSENEDLHDLDGEDISEDGSNEDDSNEESDSNDDLDESVDVSNPLRRDRKLGSGIKTVSTTDTRAEMERGNCVREQLKMWENFLEMRIKFNKCLAHGNRLPQHDSYKNYKSDNDFNAKCTDTRNNLSSLLSNLIELQAKLLGNYSETKNILSSDKKRKAEGEDENEETGDIDMDEEIPSDTENESDGDLEEPQDLDDSLDKKQVKPPRKKMKLTDFERVLSRNHKMYTEYRNSVIQKWNDKTRIASGIISKGANQPAIKQIEFALAHKEKLLKKCQLKRSEYNIIGKEMVSVEDADCRQTQEYDTEIYDDDDFYHQLLRELIEHKSADMTDPIQLSKQWIQLQSMRSKMKKKVDTRATKGRKIRYNVHQKLVNFMAPITVNDTWTDRAKDDLYSSLFGKKS